MRKSTLDPVTLNDVNDIENAPFVIEGKGSIALIIYFENEENRIQYLGTPLHTANATLTAAYAKVVAQLSPLLSINQTREE